MRKECKECNTPSDCKDCERAKQAERRPRRKEMLRRRKENLEAKMQSIAPVGAAAPKIGLPHIIADYEEEYVMQTRDTASLQKDFLSAYSRLAYIKPGGISKAAREADMPNSLHYRWCKEDPEYKSRFEEVREGIADMLETEAVKRAMNGSDQLLMFLLKGNKPEVYKERVWNEHTGKDGGPLEMGLRRMDDNELFLAINEANEAIADIQKRIGKAHETRVAALLPETT